MEVKIIKNTEKKTTTATKMDQHVDEKNKTKEQVICHGLGQELEDVKRQGNDPKMEPLRQTPKETPRDDDDDESLKNWKTEMMMKIKDDKNFRETPKMTKKEDQKENLMQREEKSKEEDHNPKGNSRQNPEDNKTKEKNNSDNTNHPPRKTTKPHVWDCESTLYDSFELNSFKRQLDSAISAASARSMSMPHLPDRRLHPSTSETAPPPQPPPPPPSSSSSSSSSGKKHTNKISRSLQKLLKSLFRPKHSQQRSSSSAPTSPASKAFHGGDADRYYVVYDKSGSLTTIPESAETDVGPPEITSLVRKTASERFTAARVVGISCA